MLIRQAYTADIPSLTEVRFAVRENVLNNPALVTADDYVDYLTRRGKGWVAEEDGRLAGFAIADVQDHSIWALFVHPNYDRRGIGRALHDEMLKWYFAQTSEPVAQYGPRYPRRRILSPCRLAGNRPYEEQRNTV